MKDYIELGPTPYEENCAQTTAEDYSEKSYVECRAYANQLKRILNGKDEECGLRITVKSFPHDYGSYREVCAVYDDSNYDAMNLATELENNCPATWDREARRELGLV